MKDIKTFLESSGETDGIISLDKYSKNHWENMIKDVILDKMSDSFRGIQFDYDGDIKWTTKNVPDNLNKTMIVIINIKESEKNKKNKDKVVDVVASFNRDYTGKLENWWEYFADKYKIDFNLQVSNNNVFDIDDRK